MTALRIRLPRYTRPRNKWRRRIIDRARKEQAARSIAKFTEGRLSVDIMLYLGTENLEKSDVDNRLKDILGALQGRYGGPKAKKHPYLAVMKNDALVYRATIEKKRRPKSSSDGGWLTLRSIG